MNPDIAKKLMSDVPEMREFVAYLAGESLKLNNIDDIEATEPIEVAVEVKGRKLAYKKIVDILNPLINTQEASVDNKGEYVV